MAIINNWKKSIYKVCLHILTHIQNIWDFKRNYWDGRDSSCNQQKGVAILKGVSGQGKTTPCYRYLIDTYPEGWVFVYVPLLTKPSTKFSFSVRRSGKHNKHPSSSISMYNQAKHFGHFYFKSYNLGGLSIPVLISIRDEDYNRTPISGKAIQYGIIELALSKEEAARIYSSF